MLTTDEIQFFMRDAAASPFRQNAELGQRYYDGKHDIDDFRVMYVDSEGGWREDKNRSNVTISHQFFTELVDQQANYMLSQGNYVRSNDEELQAHLDQYFNDDFEAELTDTLTGAIAKGSDYMFAYKDSHNKLRFQYADSLGVIEVRARDTEDKVDYVIYHYQDHIATEGKTVTKIQVWDHEKTTFYVREGLNGQIVPDESEPINPRPHVIFRVDSDPNSLYYSELGYIPFFRLDNNKKRTSAVNSVKGLIDDYDLMACGLSNNIQDGVEALTVVRGVEGDDLGELMENIKAKKFIGFGDEVENSGVDFKTVDIPVEARREKLQLDEKNIYRFGMGFNTAELGDAGGNITNVMIKSRYALLDLKCNKTEIRLKQFLRKLVRVVIDEINRDSDRGWSEKDVYFVFEREIMTNAKDNAEIEQLDAQTKRTELDTLLDAAHYIGDEQTLRGIAEILDIDYSDIRTDTTETVVDLIERERSILDELDNEDE